jgi:hypothetical protein
LQEKAVLEPGVAPRVRPQGATPPAASAAALLRLHPAWWPSAAPQQRACYVDDAAGKAEAEAEAAASASAAGSNGGSDAEAPTVEQLTAELREREKSVEELQAKVG